MIKLYIISFIIISIVLTDGHASLCCSFLQTTNFVMTWTCTEKCYKIILNYILLVLSSLVFIVLTDRGMQVCVVLNLLLWAFLP